MESKITQNPLPTKKKKKRSWEGQKFEKNKVDHMVSGEATYAEFALQAYFYSFSGLLAWIPERLSTYTSCCAIRREE